MLSHHPFFHLNFLISLSKTTKRWELNHGWKLQSRISSDGPQKPTQEKLEKHAKSLLKAASIRPVHMQGSLSYTVVATIETIVSFRVPEAKLGGEVDKLAHKIHGDLAPEATCHGTIVGDSPDGQPLMVCTMPLLPGKSLLEIISAKAELDEAALKKQLTFVTHLAQ